MPEFWFASSPLWFGEVGAYFLRERDDIAVTVAVARAREPPYSGETRTSEADGTVTRRDDGGAWSGRSKRGVASEEHAPEVAPRGDSGPRGARVMQCGDGVEEVTTLEHDDDDAGVRA